MDYRLFKIIENKFYTDIKDSISHYFKENNYPENTIINECIILFANKLNRKNIKKESISLYQILCYCSYNNSVFEMQSLFSIDGYGNENDIRFTSVKNYSYDYSIDDLINVFVPKINTFDEYEQLSQFFLNDVYPEYVSNVIDINTIVKRLGLKIYSIEDKSDLDFYGKMYFYTSKIYCNDEIIDIPAETIVINEKMCRNQSNYSRDIIILHECIHYYFHRHIFRLVRTMNKKITNIVDTVGNKIHIDDSLYIRDIETQAYVLAPMIYMPKALFISKLSELISKFQKNNDFLDYASNVILELSKYFKVGIPFVKKRLKDLGHYQYDGILNFIDNHYVPNYICKKKSKNSYDTFTISLRNSIKFFSTSTQIKMPVQLGLFLFVENHWCLNNEKYIKKENGYLSLTSYARNHIDECCLNFRLYNREQYNDYIANMEYLCMNSNFIYSIDVPLSTENNVLKKVSLAECFANHLKEKNELEFIKNMKLDEALKTLMRYYGIKNSELAKKSGLSIKTIERYVNGENTVPDKKTIIQLCIGIGAIPEVSYYLMSSAGIMLKPGDGLDDAYSLIISGLGNYEINYIDELLEEAGFPKLTNK